jgi:mitochondrial import receptor subunit TOM40
MQGKYQFQANEHWLAKSQVQLSSRPGYSMYQLEGEYLGSDYSLNAKAINMHPGDGTGIYTLGYFQSITSRIAVGLEGMLQRPFPDLTEAGMSLFGRFAANSSQIFTLTLQNLVGVQASYFHKVSEQVELASEWQGLLAGPQMESVASISGKFTYRQATVRAQVDSLGKLGVFLEERILGTVSLLISGEIDHWKAKSRFGVGLSIEN